MIRIILTGELINLITTLFKGAVSPELICFIISLFPVLELRGGLLAASPAFLNVPILRAVPICILGNLLPIPFVLLLIERVLGIMERFSPSKGLALWLRERAEKNKEKIEKFGFFGLVFFVAIPLPGTGAWTGSLIAALFHLSFKKSFLACVIGVLIAALIMSIVSYGLLGALAALIK